jgi:hypothetical protein
MDVNAHEQQQGKARQACSAGLDHRHTVFIGNKETSLVCSEENRRDWENRESIWMDGISHFLSLCFTSHTFLD